jgi:beta-lactamase regulating signal transducer with metallopeptidase domain
MNSLSFVIGVQIVQVTLCIAAAALVSLTCLRKRPAWAAAVWLAVLCKCATPPVWASPLGVFSWLRAEKPRTPTELPSWVQLAPRRSPQPNPIVEAPIAMAEAAPSATIPWSAIWPWMLAAVWAAGFVVIFSRAFRQKRRWLAAVVEDCDPPGWIVDAVAERSRKLGIKPPRIVMVAADAGPAASGWLRPTVYLPMDADSAELEAMLVHELVHLRRRDPWLGALQAFVCAAYWFHPGVRWASDELSRCIEEACDTETVCELGCKPVEYAAALVALLERRVAPSSVPLVAGMSPARCVKRRLEAVMKTNPNRRGGLACGPWLAFAAASLIALPGAGLPPEQPKEQPKLVPAGAILPNPVAANSVELDFLPLKPVEIKNFSHRGYDLKPAADVLMKRYGLREDAASNAVANMILAVAESIGPRPVFAMADQRLFAFAAEAQHELMRHVVVDTAEELAFKQVVIETEIWSLPTETLERMHFHPSEGAKNGGTAYITEKDYKEFSKRWMEDKRVKLLAAPKLTTLDGQKAEMKFGTEHATGGVDKDGNPLKAWVGVGLVVEPKHKSEHDTVTMKIHFNESCIRGYVSKGAANESAGPTPGTPIVNNTVIETSVTCGWGTRMVVQAPNSKLLVLKCVKAPAPAMSFNIDPPGDGLVKGRSDPRMRKAMTQFQSRIKQGAPVTRVYTVAHLFRGAAHIDGQLLDLAHALCDVFNGLERRSDDLKQTMNITAGRPTIVVNMTPELHDAVARMIRDVDPRKNVVDPRIPRETPYSVPLGN